MIDREMVIIRMDIEGLGQKLASAFAVHADEVKKIAEQEIDAAIERFDLRALCRAEAERQLDKLVREVVGQRYASKRLYQKLKEVADLLAGEMCS